MLRRLLAPLRRRLGPVGYPRARAFARSAFIFSAIVVSALWLVFVLPHAVLLDFVADRAERWLPGPLSRGLARRRFWLAQLWAALAVACILNPPALAIHLGPVVGTATTVHLLRLVVELSIALVQVILNVCGNVLQSAATSNTLVYWGCIWLACLSLR